MEKISWRKKSSWWTKPKKGKAIWEGLIRIILGKWSRKWLISITPTLIQLAKLVLCMKFRLKISKDGQKMELIVNKELAEKDWILVWKTNSLTKLRISFNLIRSLNTRKLRFWHWAYQRLNILKPAKDGLWALLNVTNSTRLTRLAEILMRWLRKIK